MLDEQLIIHHPAIAFLPFTGGTPALEGGAVGILRQTPGRASWTNHDQHAHRSYRPNYGLDFRQVTPVRSLLTIDRDNPVDILPDRNERSGNTSGQEDAMDYILKPQTVPTR